MEAADHRRILAAITSELYTLEEFDDQFRQAILAEDARTEDRTSESLRRATLA